MSATLQIQAWMRGAAVKRFHTVPIIGENTVGHHSGGVAMLCAAIYGREVRSELLLAALAHDLPEYLVGDVPSPTKRVCPDLQRTEDKYLKDHDLLCELTLEEAKILHYADAAEGLLFCAVQAMFNNAHITVVGRNYRHYIRSRYTDIVHTPSPLKAPNLTEVHNFILEESHVFS